MSDEFRQRVLKSAWDSEPWLRSVNVANMERVLDVLASEPWVRDEWARVMFTRHYAEAVQATLRRDA